MIRLSSHSLIHGRCPTMWDGGDNLVAILLLYAIPIDFGEDTTDRWRPQD